jgi:hypothetical protein
MKCAALLLVAIFGFAFSAYTDLITIPAGAGRSQNGYTYLKASTMLELYGRPCALSQDCKSVTNPTLSPLIQTRKIGKFTLTGMKQALDAISRALDDVARNDPGLYAAIGSSGMLCCRAIRGSTTTFSNHAWGAAADFNINGVLDPRGDGKCQRGLASLWPYMQKQGFYWAAGYSGSSEDAMHFEIADEVMRNWGSSGDYGGCTSSSGVRGECKDVSQCSATTEAGKCPGPANIKCCFTSGTPPPPATYRCCTASTLNIRSGPCTTYSIMGTVTQGQSMVLVNGNAVAGCSNNWVQVRRNGITGYVSTSFITPCTPNLASEFNSTIEDEPVAGQFFADGDDAYAYDETEDGAASKLVVLFAAILALAAVF